MSRILKGRGVLKPGHLGLLGRGREVMEAAERAAARTAESAADRAAAIGIEAERQGFEAGMARAAASCIEAEARRARWLDGAREDLVEVALAAAASIVASARDLDPGVVARAVEESVVRIRGARRIEVRVAPCDERALDDLALRGLPIGVKADPGIAPGGCLIETDLGTVDGRIETRLQSLREALEGVVARMGRVEGGGE